MTLNLRRRYPHAQQSSHKKTKQQIRRHLRQSVPKFIDQRRYSLEHRTPLFQSFIFLYEIRAGLFRPFLTAEPKKSANTLIV
jgi:hypothetical protein